MSQTDVMRVLKESGRPMSVLELADILHIRKANIYRQVKMLTRFGFIHRTKPIAAKYKSFCLYEVAQDGS